MRKFVIIAWCCFAINLVSAQNITSAEYYFDDSDNGFGSNTIVTVNQQNENYTISTAGLSDGFHDLYIRVFDQAADGGNGVWSHYDRSTIYINSFPTGQDIVAARYFIDSGNPLDLTVNPTANQITETYSIPIGSLSEGFHDLYIQTQDTDGTWSLYDRKVFYVSAFPSGEDIVAARYFFNNETPINLPIDTSAPNISQSYSLATTGLDEGFHNFYIQAQDTDGTWSLYDSQVIYIGAFDEVPSDVISAEYFIDEDLGIGNNTNFSITNPSQMISVNTSGLAIGSHLFCVRVQNMDGSWSLYDCEIFIIDPDLGDIDNLFNSASINPNPFVSSIELEISKQVVIENISIYDMTGKVVYNTTNDLRHINLDHLQSGIYILSLSTTEGENASFKIVKQ
ncbi:T9SS type A sorting domain-containing protein [Winogradskyella sp. PG-2]|uniref:T9SS type A sorting domain-containing protein n=1 Tax=Winogradskyella sp. PG-2 TaxID=754409 RepID=UPI0004586BAE|nr:T9SS type A sorting domain-containing protein [Winogradskyella sp. PG-2]BAO76881.1 hypothetical protein WPG_2651 [Winogradskyella sp. PG-2]